MQERRAIACAMCNGVWTVRAGLAQPLMRVQSVVLKDGQAIVIVESEYPDGHPLVVAGWQEQ